MKTLWKSMLGTPEAPLSGSGSIGPWVVGEWRKHNGKLDMCQSGFHASENANDAMSYVSCAVMAEVEVRGKHLERDDKQVWSKMRVVRAWGWTKEDSVSLAIYSAELVIGIYEKYCLDDGRPRKAIDAAMAWLKDPSEKNRAAARSAEDAAEAAAGAAGDAARSAGAAAGAARAAAWAAAWSAWSAAWPAGNAAEAAAGAAGDAAEAAAGAAGDAARSAGDAASKDILAKCHAFIMARLASKGGAK